MSNPYYSNTGYPQFRAPGKSEDMRAELKRIEGAMERLPDPIMPNQPVFGNASGTGMMMKDKESAKALLDLDKVDNTSDADKPISTETAAEFASMRAELATKADAATLFSDLGISNFIKTLLDDVDASTAQSTLGISNFIKTLLDDVDASTAQSTLGISNFIKTLLDDVDASTAQSTLGISNFIKTLLDDVDASAAQSTLGISNFIKTLLDDVDASAARSTLGITEGAAWVKIGSLIIQGGTVVIPSNGTISTFYPLSYVSAVPIVVACNGDHQANNNGKINISSNTSKVQVELVLYDSTAPCRASWIAIGR